MSAPILRFTVSLYWNDSLVAHCVTTATTGADIARAHVVDNFAGPEAKRFALGLSFMGDAIELLPFLGSKSVEYSDKTGAARAVITKVR